jgi:hypothetical protein
MRQLIVALAEVEACAFGLGDLSSALLVVMSELGVRV